MNEFEHLPAEGVGVGANVDKEEEGGEVERGGCPGIACNKF